MRKLLVTLMTAVACFLDRLDRVRQVGPGRWTARCPSHDDKSPSLSIRETDDGTILIKCFAGCGAADVVAAVGMTLADLFPDKLSDHIPARRDRKHFHAAREVLKAISDDALLVAIAAENVAAGVMLDAADRDCLIKAAVRVRQAREVAA